MIELRAHHLLCSALYEGKGYSEEFVDNMNKIVDGLRNNCLVRIIKRPDSICAYCPNKKADGGCALENDNKEIKSLDQYIFDSFNLAENEEANSFDFYRQVKKLITEEIFDECCGNCRWKKDGICNFEKLKDAYDVILGQDIG